jgi:flagellar biosynthesis GTPase FlhF
LPVFPLFASNRRQEELEARRRAEEEERRRIEEERRKEEEEKRRQEEEQRRKMLEEQKLKEAQQSTPLQSEGASSASNQVTSNAQESTDGPSSPVPPTLWCKPKAADALRLALGESGNHVLTVARSEMAIVKVETTHEAAGIFWEFCTESYDIGFGLSFTKEGSQLEEEILKVVRRECSEDVIAGTHNFTANGTYYLKFDNTYSVFRSKQVYYRVYYCKGSEAQNEGKK